MTKGCNDASNTVVKEFKPSTLLTKYMYFKDVAAKIDKKIADINVWQGEVQQFKKDYGTMKDAPKDQREEYNLRRSELIGMIASYNDLASEYNAQMAKFNWSFCNVGSLPEGATEPLPREFKPYINSSN